MSDWMLLAVPASAYAEMAADAHRRAQALGLDMTEVTISLANAATGHEAASGSEPTVDPTGLASWPSWSEDALVRFADSDVTTVQRWVRAMDALAVEDSKTWFTTSEVAKLSGLTINEWRDAPRKITRHLAAHYADAPLADDGHHAWPLKAYSFNSTEVSWAMTPETKRLWRKVRGL